MDFGILGPLEVRDGSGLVRVPGAKERALLADLLVHAGRVVAADRLVEDLWGERPPGSPANTLQGRVSALRRALGPAGPALVVTRPPGDALEAGPEQLDAGRFERLVAEATALGPDAGPGAARLLAEALALWRGPALAEFADRPWAQAEAVRLEELRLAAREALVELRLAAGGHAGLVGELEGLVGAYPTRERLRGQLMVALYRSGRQADALGVYAETRRVLAEELGIDPSPELQRLQRQVLVQDPALEAAAADRQQPRHNLPERLTSLVGREVELREVAKLVEQHRLVTVTGPGGAGKTSLAVAVAERLVARHPDGVWLVELAALSDPALLAEVVAAALGLGEAVEPAMAAPGPAGRLAGHVADKAMLLVLDNCEHLVGACAELARRLLQAGPGVRVLATSREVLGVPGEVVWPIPPLAVPAPAADGAAEAGDQAAPEVLAGYDAVRLFVERATSADPGFVLDAASGPVVAELCRRLDGLPLAIELAAARTRALPPVELAVRLEDRFRLLSGGARTLDPRQQTLRATVDWSWDLLEGPDRRLLRRLSVFSGGWTVAAAEAVCGGDGLEGAEVLDGLFRLVDRSLIVRGTAPARFTMLETLRAYGAERLAEAGEAQTLAARHTAWCLRLAERAAAHRTARPWLRRVDADYDNLRAALDRAVAARDHDPALRLAGALGWYWWTERTIEGRQRLADVLALADGQPPTLSLARVLQAAAMVEVSLTPTAVTTEQARRSRELFERFGDRWGPRSPSCCWPGPSCSGAAPARRAPAWSRRPIRPSPSSATCGARPTRDGPGSRSSPTTGACRSRPRRRGSGPWRSSRCSTTSGDWPRPTSALARSPGPVATWPGRSPASRARWPRPATEAPCGWCWPRWWSWVACWRSRGTTPGRPPSMPRGPPCSAGPGCAAGSPTSTTSWAASPAFAATWSGPASSTRRPWPSSVRRSAGASPIPWPSSRAPRPASASSTTPGRTWGRRSACSGPSPSRPPPPPSWSARPWSRSATAGPGRPRGCWPPPRRSAGASA
jgi:predicted ATPase